LRFPLEALERLSQDPDAQRQAREREDSLRFYDMGLAQSERDGIAKGEKRGIAKGVRQNQVQTIEALCKATGIELTPARRAVLDDPNVDVAMIVSSLIAERRWL
jgi:hypothetical protein